MLKSTFPTSPAQPSQKPWLRRLLAAALILCLLPACALAFEGNGYPAPSGALPADSLAGSFGDMALLLSLDAEPDYSHMENGFVTACFFAFSEDQQNYLELYLTLPATVISGDVLSSSDMLATGTSIYLYEITPYGESLYSADQMLGIPFPLASSYEISIREASLSDTAICLRGSIAASLVRSEEAANQPQAIDLSDVSFDFTLPIGGTADSPKGGLQKAPAFTLPPDYAIA